MSSEVPAATSEAPGRYQLRLYVLGQSPASLRAIANLAAVCEENLSGRYTIEVIDLREQPHRVVEDQIVAVPTLVKALPLPLRTIIGDLSDTERVLVGLELRPAPARS